MSCDVGRSGRAAGLPLWSARPGARSDSTRAFSHPKVLPSACGCDLVIALARDVQTRPMAVLMERFIDFSASRVTRNRQPREPRATAANACSSHYETCGARLDFAATYRQ